VHGCATLSGHYHFPADSHSVSRARHAVTGFAREHGVPGELLDDIALAVSEACTNVVIHAYREGAEAGSLSIGLELEERSLHIQVGDDGLGMRPRIASVSDGFAVEPGADGGTDLYMRFDLASPLAA
jgi:serine/threonine-protein kinase RsbW